MFKKFFFQNSSKILIFLYFQNKKKIFFKRFHKIFNFKKFLISSSFYFKINLIKKNKKYVKGKKINTF